MGFFRQEDWTGLPFLPPGDHPDSGIKFRSPASPALQADSLPFVPPGFSKLNECMNRQTTLLPAWQW